MSYIYTAHMCRNKKINYDKKMSKSNPNIMINTLSEDTLLEIIRLVFTDQLTDQEIANYAGMSKPTLYKFKKTERFQLALKAYGEVAVREADAKIQANVDKAVNKLISLLDSDIPSVQLKASTELIRLAGLGQTLPNFTPAQPPQSDQATVLQYLQVIALEQGKQSEPISS